MLKEHTRRAVAPPDRSTLMHTRGHAYYGTACPDRCGIVAKWAARRLITPRAFLLAVRASTDWDGIAELLGVTDSDVTAYLAVLGPEEWTIMMSLVGRDLRAKA